MRIILASIFLAACLPVYAENFSCEGEVKYIGIHPTAGTLQVDIGRGVHYLCALHEEINGVHPEICKAWYSMYLTAQASGRKVLQYYSGENGTNCSTLGNWAVPNPMPYHIALKN